jgi:hypothetical protein
MEDFFWIILVVAAILLIMSMTFVGVVMYTSTSSAVFPPRANACPDYWDVGVSCSDTTCTYASKNIGNLANAAVVTSSTPPSASVSSGVIYSADAKWANSIKFPGKTGFCAKQAWSVNNGITWDGVSNSNVC